MPMLARATQQVKSNVTRFLPQHVIREAADAAGHPYRDRKLGPVRTVLLLVLQMLAGNASLADARGIGGRDFGISALSQARGRLPLALLQHVLQWLVTRGLGPGEAVRVVLIDAFNTLAPDTRPLRRKYRRPRQQRSRCDYPQVRCVGVFDLTSGLLLAQHDFPADRHESPQLRHVLSALRPGDVAVFDRGFVSYANLCLLRARGVHVVARLARGLVAKRQTRRTRVKRLGKRDATVCWQKPATRPPGGPSRADWAKLPDTLSLRELTVTNRSGRSRRVTLVTDLTDPKTRPASQLAQWYQRRWEVETDIRHLKSTMNLEFFRTRSVANVRRELLIRAIAYNLVRLAMLESAERKKLDDPSRVSFADALRWLNETAPGVGPIDRLESLTRLLTNPRRSRTSRPRKVKYRGKNYRVQATRPVPQKLIA